MGLVIAIIIVVWLWWIAIWGWGGWGNTGAQGNGGFGGAGQNQPVVQQAPQNGDMHVLVALNPLMYRETSLAEHKVADLEEQIDAFRDLSTSLVKDFSLRGCAYRGMIPLCERRAQDARSYGKLPKLPVPRERACPPYPHYSLHTSIDLSSDSS